MCFLWGEKTGKTKNVLQSFEAKYRDNLYDIGTSSHHLSSSDENQRQCGSPKSSKNLMISSLQQMAQFSHENSWSMTMARHLLYVQLYSEYSIDL